MAVDFFLKLADIPGESVDSKHPNEITVMSFSWGASQTTSVSGTGGSGAGKASLADLSIMKNRSEVWRRRKPLPDDFSQGSFRHQHSDQRFERDPDGERFLQLQRDRDSVRSAG
jgi:hypothetical protein